MNTLTIMKTKANAYQQKAICYSLVTLAILFLASCQPKKSTFDASGSFEAQETIVSAEATGRIQQFTIEEGDLLQAGQTVGYIDSVQIYLKKKQIEAQIKAAGYKLPDISTQTGFYNQQQIVTQTRLKNLLHEQKRFQNLVKAEAATQKQVDDINAQVEEAQKQMVVIQKQQEAQRSALQTQTSGIKGELLPLSVQLQQVEDQLAKCRIVNPVNGTVLTKYAEAFEITTPGKPLYKIADLSSMILRAYVSGNQLTQVKLNQKVKVMTDDIDGKFKTTEGTISWINDKAEFTPKTIQTKNERANMVYAIKIIVKNDGQLKIGMYGEIKFN